METSIFTPRRFVGDGWRSEERLKMRISKKDRERYSAAQRDEWVRVHDHASGKEYEVKSAPCGLNCHCDAVYKEVND